LTVAADDRIDGAAELLYLFGRGQHPLAGGHRSLEVPPQLLAVW
jgi:hypothetical protein